MPGLIFSVLPFSHMLVEISFKFEKREMRGEKTMNVKYLFVVYVATAMLFITASASARLVMLPYISVTATPNNSLVNCPGGCVKPIEGVLAGYAPYYAHTWTYEVSIYLEDASASDLDSLSLSYNSSGNCLKLDGGSYLDNGNGGLTIALDSTAPAIDASKLAFIDGICTFTLVTNNAFTSGVGHDKHMLTAELNYTFDGMTWNATGSASGFDCIPEPTTMSLLALGAITLIRRRK